MVGQKNEHQNGIRVWNAIELHLESVFGAYLNCTQKLILTKYQNGIRVWSVSELYPEVYFD